MQILKYFLSVVALIAISLPQPAYSQEKISDATLEYDISVGSSGKPVPKGLEGATMSVFLKPLESRSEFKSAAGMETTIYNTKSAKGAILKEYSGQKLMITITRENWEKKNELYRNLNFVEETNSYVVAGYPVKKSVGTLPGGKSFVVFYAPSIQLQNVQYNYAFSQLDGLPVKFEIESGEITFTYTLKKFNTDPVVASKFTIPQTGYRVMSFEESEELKKRNKK